MEDVLAAMVSSAHCPKIDLSRGESCLPLATAFFNSPQTISTPRMDVQPETDSIVLRSAAFLRFSSALLAAVIVPKYASSHLFCSFKKSAHAEIRARLSSSPCHWRNSLPSFFVNHCPE